jgi:hypothetical protein
MKKSTLFTKILLLSLLFLNACSKKEQLSPVNNPPEQNPVAPLSASLFDELNETIARFDPLYLQIVYKDKRSKAMINDEASRLLVAINQNPTSLVIQKDLIELYHFKSFADLQKASDIISNNASVLKKSFLGQDTVLSKSKMTQLNEARKTFIKNKISTFEKASQRSSSGLWTDNAAWILDQFHYYTQVGNLEMGLDGMEDLGGTGNGGGCNESCCFEYQTCMINANSAFTMRLIGYGIGGIFGGITAGGSAGSIIPVIGNIYGAAYGGWLGGVAGYTVAIELYMNDQKVCALNYKACILRKMGN